MNYVRNNSSTLPNSLVLKVYIWKLSHEVLLWNSGCIIFTLATPLYEQLTHPCVILSHPPVTQNKLRQILELISEQLIWKCSLYRMVPYYTFQLGNVEHRMQTSPIGEVQAKATFPT